MQKGYLLHALHAWLLISSLCVFCSCSTIKAQEIFKQPVGVTLNSEIDKTVFRINHLGDLPDMFGGHNILDRAIMIMPPISDDLSFSHSRRLMPNWSCHDRHKAFLLEVPVSCQHLRYLPLLHQHHGKAVSQAIAFVWSGFVEGKAI